MAPLTRGCEMMDYAYAHEGQQGSLSDLAQSLRLQSPFLSSEYALQQASNMSPVSALGHGFNSPGLGSVDPVLPSINASASTSMSQTELNERLQQLLALQHAQQSSPMQNGSLAEAQMSPLLSGGNLELGELLALQAALGALVLHLMALGRWDLTATLSTR